MPDLHDQIADLEAQIEELSRAGERCARMMLAAKALTIGCILLLAFILTGLIRFSPLLFVIAISGVLGGIAFFGSTKSTRDQIMATIRLLEARRSEMIDGLELISST